MKRWDKEIRKQPLASGDLGSRGIPAPQQNSGIDTTSGISARLFPYLIRRGSTHALAAAGSIFDTVHAGKRALARGTHVPCTTQQVV